MYDEDEAMKILLDARSAKSAQVLNAGAERAKKEAARKEDIRQVYQPVLNLTKAAVAKHATNYGVMTETDSKFGIGLSGILSEVTVEYKGEGKFRITMPKEKAPHELASDVVHDNLAPEYAVKVIMQFLGENGTSK